MLTCGAHITILPPTSVYGSHSATLACVAHKPVWVSSGHVSMWVPQRGTIWPRHHVGPTLPCDLPCQQVGAPLGSVFFHVSMLGPPQPHGLTCGTHIATLVFWTHTVTSLCGTDLLGFIMLIVTLKKCYFNSIYLSYVTLAMSTNVTQTTNITLK